MRLIAAFLRRVLLAAATGYIFMFYAERMFWSFWREGEDSQGSLFATWLVYSIAAEICLLVIRAARVRDIRAVFLVGALMGWLVEGVFTMTLFGAEGIPFPVTVSWTGLAWHALVVVVIGWWGLQRALVISWGRAAAVSAGLGIFWGAWSIFWPHRPPPGWFTVHAVIASIGLIIALRAAHACRCGTLRVSRIEAAVLTVLVLLFLGGVTIPHHGVLAAVSLPVLFALILWGLWRNRGAETGPDALSAIEARIPWPRMTAVLAMPVLALLIHEACQGSGYWAPTNLVVFYTTTPIGAVAFVVSLWWLVRRCPAAA